LLNVTHLLGDVLTDECKTQQLNRSDNLKGNGDGYGREIRIGYRNLKVVDASDEENKLMEHLQKNDYSEAGVDVVGQLDDSDVVTAQLPQSVDDTGRFIIHQRCDLMLDVIQLLQYRSTGYAEKNQGRSRIHLPL